MFGDPIDPKKEQEKLLKNVKKAVTKFETFGDDREAIEKAAREHGLDREEVMKALLSSGVAALAEVRTAQNPGAEVDLCKVIQMSEDIAERALKEAGSLMNHAIFLAVDPDEGPILVQMDLSGMPNSKAAAHATERMGRQFKAYACILVMEAWASQMSYETYEGGDYVSPSEAEDKMDIVLVAVYATGSKPYVRTRPFTLDPFTWAEEKWTEGPVEGDVTFAIDPCRDGVAP